MDENKKPPLLKERLSADKVFFYLQMGRFQIFAIQKIFYLQVNGLKTMVAPGNIKVNRTWI